MSIPVLDKLPFTLQCLPFGVVSTADSEPRCAVAIGDHTIDLARYARSGRLDGVSEGNKSGVEFENIFKQVSTHCKYDFQKIDPEGYQTVEYWTDSKKKILKENIN